MKQQCPHCGEYAVRWLDHNEVDDGDPAYDERRAHRYCNNCDYGICGECL